MRNTRARDWLNRPLPFLGRKPRLFLRDVSRTGRHVESINQQICLRSGEIRLVNAHGYFPSFSWKQGDVVVVPEDRQDFQFVSIFYKAQPGQESYAGARV